jgi:pimeloyl-ACP methyl ester carboxylesterase
MEEPKQQRITIAGCEIAQFRVGNGPPLLYLHGTAGAARWTPFFAELAAHFEVIVPEHPGFGQSATPDWFDNIHDLAYFYLDFLKAQKLERVHLVGASIGGWVALELAVRSTVALASLSLIAPAGIYVQGKPPSDIFLWSEEKLIRNSVADPALADRLLAEAATVEAMDRALKNNYGTARIAWEPRLHDPHLRKWLHRIDVPTQLIWGREDRVFPPDYAAEFARLIPGAKMAMLERCGHLPEIEQPEALARAIGGFVGEAAR